MKRIFITGSSGCIGHYMAEALIQETNHELYFLVRNHHKLQFNYQSRPNVHLMIGDLQNIEKFSDFLKTVNVAILAATSWGGINESFEINVTKTLGLMKLLDPDICEQIIYFSTASILDKNNQPLPEAGRLGTNYIRTKYQCYTQLYKLPIYNKVTTVFPTLVFGGEPNKPYSHLSGGIKDVIKWVDLIRWFKADGSFHYIHARDIAQVIRHLVENNPTEADSRDLVLGNKKVTVNEAIKEICNYLNKKIYFQITLYIILVNFFIKAFRLRMEDWDYFSINYRHFTYKDTVTPASFNLENYCTTIEDVMQLSGVYPKKDKK
ncbi:NAD-dependent epimerase/dehydratase family protein [Crocosphaera watsonii WH 8501]|uniref:Similar to Nucleoside-diphosphate-sugar epimerases n=1 Tax=Crocosphaera watsonii WH 8501 TaxID=165597 RepID=Q4BY82_CROWT|nr:NAD(P)-dependent oxidoreductase [Crocosphaera watsonii]EAM48862.1 similar to Nucleoside-diphosphate-sugar epimerases [Crocosphaera watsonii WH 8501]